MGEPVTVGVNVTGEVGLGLSFAGGVRVCVGISVTVPVNKSVVGNKCVGDEVEIQYCFGVGDPVGGTGGGVIRDGDGLIITKGM